MIEEFDQNYETSSSRAKKYLFNIKKKKKNAKYSKINKNGAKNSEFDGKNSENIEIKQEFIAEDPKNILEEQVDGIKLKYLKQYSKQRDFSSSEEGNKSHRNFPRKTVEDNNNNSQKSFSLSSNKNKRKRENEENYYEINEKSEKPEKKILLDKSSSPQLYKRIIPQKLENSSTQNGKNSLEKIAYNKEKYKPNIPIFRYLEPKTKGNFIYGDRPEKIVSSKFIGDEVICEIEWFERENGEKPQNSSHSNTFIKEFDPLLLANFYEQKIRVMPGKINEKNKFSIFLRNEFELKLLKTGENQDNNGVNFGQENEDSEN